MKKYYKTILVGNSGFLGRSFLKSDTTILSVGRTDLRPDYTNEHLHISSWNDFNQLEQIEFDYAIFLIGSSDHELINNAPTLAIEKNFLPLLTFLDYLKERDSKPKKVFTFTTMLQYDSEKLTLPCSESAPINPFGNKYIFSKYIAEQTSQFYRKYFDIIDIRLSNVYGPTELRRPDIVPSLIWSLLEDDITYVRTTIPVRDFVFVGDVISAVNQLSFTDFSGPINIGSGIGSSVKELCDILEEVSGKTIIELGEPFTGHKTYYHDLGLLGSLIRHEETSLRDGLIRTYEEMKAANQRVEW
jgi:nucleoside-diphosphate-sugar epimerase